MTVQDGVTVSVETEVGSVTVCRYRHHKTELRLPRHPYGSGPRRVIDPANITARDCDDAAAILLIQRQLVEPAELSFAQIRALDSGDRLALVEAILSEGRSSP